MLMSIITILLLFPMIFLRGTVYLCGDSSYADEQCMNRETLGDIEFIWVRKCKGAKVCLTLPYYDKIIGACNTKVRTHYDGESCLNDNKCSTRICDGSKCKGYQEGHACIPGLAQCEKGLVCTYPDDETKIAICSQPIGEGQDCYVYSKNETSIKDDEYSIYGNEYSFFVPWYNPCELNYACDSESLPNESRQKGTCKELGSISNSIASTPLLCTTGTFSDKDGTCGTPENQKNCIPFSFNNNESNIGCMNSSKGVSWAQNESLTTEFTEWLSQSKEHKKKQEDQILEAYRYTRNNKKINEKFFRYTHYGWITDADKCAYDYLWKNSKGNWVKVSLLIFILSLLF